MSKIINNLRIFSRPSRSEIHELDIHKPIEDALMLISQQLKVHGIEVKKSYSQNIPKILGDTNQLQQVFSNLITNARDALEKTNNKIIKIKTHPTRNGHFIEINFIDSGSGIKSKVIDQVFNPFFTTKDPGKGTGLGLSISYGIIQNHGGTMHIQQRKSRGTTISIFLPTIIREPCWEIKKCMPNERKNCIAYKENKTYVCWSTLGYDKNNKGKKRQLLKCETCQILRERKKMFDQF